MEIPLGKGLVALVDGHDFGWMNMMRWFPLKSAGCVYAATKMPWEGQIKTIRMHRLIADTPPLQDCHHKNRNTLDNRRANLENVTPNDHQDIHKNRIF